MKEYIARAIEGRQLLRLVYEGKRRLTVEPHVLGQTLEGDDALLAWQVAPPPASGTAWRLLKLAEVMELQVLDRPFEAEPEGRRPLTDQFSRIELRA